MNKTNQPDRVPGGLYQKLSDLPGILPFMFCGFQLFFADVTSISWKGKGKRCRNRRFVGSKGQGIVGVDVNISFEKDRK